MSVFTTEDCADNDYI